MTTGVRVIWHDDDGKIIEIEYFYGIDVADLDQIPEFSRVQAFWPESVDLTWGEWVVDAHCDRTQPGEVRLVVTYDKAKQPSGYEFYPGTNTIILQEGEQTGRCEWLREGTEDLYEVEWEAFGAARARPRAKYRGSRREAKFREMILSCDGHHCVLTGEETTKALDAAHLIPAAMGENDVPNNGITLRADLHRLFDAGLFTFAADGRIVEINPKLSAYYCGLLKDLSLRPRTLERVRATLALPEFQDRS